MNTVFIALFSIIVLFILFLIIKQIVKVNFCAICASVSLTWAILLFLYWNGMIVNPLVIGILMGQSIIGIYYLLEKKLDEKWYLFRLPYILTATLLVIGLIGEREDLKNNLTLVVSVWVVFGIIHFTQSNPKVKKIAERVIACCKNW